VFFARFVAVLRVLAAVLAGVNRMDWRRFLLANAAGGIVWAGPQAERAAAHPGRER
jgi:membrane protein DedA with SNARE-associated domain